MRDIEKNKIWRANHPEMIREIKRNYYERNREKIIAANTLYRLQREVKESIIELGYEIRKGKHPIHCLICDEKYKLLGRHVELHYEAHLREIDQEEGTNFMANNNMGKSLQQSEFDQIKELLFRGETLSEITRITGRGASTIKQAEQAKTLEEYFEIGRSIWGKYKNPQTVVKPEPIRVVNTRYNRLKEMKENLDVVIADFIVGEIETRHKELVEEIRRKDKEIARLNEVIERMQTTDISQLVAERLKPKQIEANTQHE